MYASTRCHCLLLLLPLSLQFLMWDKSGTSSRELKSQPTKGAIPHTQLRPWCPKHGDHCSLMTWDCITCTQPEKKNQKKKNGKVPSRPLSIIKNDIAFYVYVYMCQHKEPIRSKPVIPPHSIFSIFLLTTRSPSRSHPVCSFLHKTYLIGIISYPPPVDADLIYTL